MSIVKRFAKKAVAPLLNASAKILAPEPRKLEFPPPVKVPEANPKWVAYLLGDPVLAVPMSRVRYPDGRPYTYEHHHFLQYYQGGLRRLREFYARHQPSNIFEFFFLTAPRPTTAEVGGRPWFRIVRPKRNPGEAGLPAAKHGFQEYGPVSEERIRSEANRLDQVLDSIQKHGFRPEMGGYVRGYFMLRDDGNWVFVIRQGFHRTAALAHSGAETIHVRFQPRYPRFVDERDSREWPMVKDGIVTEAEALSMFHQFFAQNERVPRAHST